MFVYQLIAGHLDAYQRCISENNLEWQVKHYDILRKIEQNHLPSGGGINVGCSIEDTIPYKNKVVIYSSFHCMDDAGMYTHWIDFSVTITPSLIHEFDLTIKGKFGKHQDLKEYLYVTFTCSLSAECQLN